MRTRVVLPDGCPAHCMWGQVDYAYEIADGWWSVGTPSHGGHILSRERLLQMPENWRSTAYSGGGQFEEDCDWCLPAVWFRNEFIHYARQNASKWRDGYDPSEAAFSTLTWWHADRAKELRGLTGLTGMSLHGFTYDHKVKASLV